MWRFVFCLIPGVAFAQVDQGAANAAFAPAFAGQTRAAEFPASRVDVQVFASGLDFPWGIVALPDGRLLVTERDGTLQMIGADGALLGPVGGLPPVEAVRQGGLLDIAVAADFAESGIVYWTYSKPVDGGSATAAGRGVLVDNMLTQVVDIFVQSPALQSGVHFGSRIVPADGGVFVTTGDRG